MYSTSSKHGFSHDNERQATLLLKNRSLSYFPACPSILKGEYYGKQNTNAVTFEIQKKIVSLQKIQLHFLTLFYCVERGFFQLQLFVTVLNHGCVFEVKQISHMPVSWKNLILLFVRKSSWIICEWAQFIDYHLILSEKRRQHIGVETSADTVWVFIHDSNFPPAHLLSLKNKSRATEKNFFNFVS